MRERRVAHEVGGAEAGNAGLARAKVLAGATDSQIGFCDFEALRRALEHLQTLHRIGAAFVAGDETAERLTTAPPDWKQGIDYLGVVTRLLESDAKARAQLAQAEEPSDDIPF